jgi:hypothetical protein
MCSASGILARTAMTAATVVVLSSCGHGESEKADMAVTIPGFGPTLVGVERRLGGPAYEPTLTITPQGNIFYTGGTPHNDAATHPGTGWIFASYDNGATWVNATAGLVTTDPPMYDNYMTSDPVTGRVMRATLQPQSVGGNGCLQVIWSDDQGQSWSEKPMVCAVTPPFHDHESFAFGPPLGPVATSEYPSLTYLCVNHPQGTECAVSADGGLTYRAPVPVFPSVDPISGTGAYCGGLNSPVKVDSAGRAFVPRLWCDRPEVASSDDGGVTWTAHAVGGPLASRGPAGGVGVADETEPRYIDLGVMHLAIDVADNLHVAYVAADGLPYYLYSTDHGAAWSAPRPIAAPGITAVAPSLITIGAGAAGHVAFAYLSTGHPGGLAATDWAGARWDMKLGVLTDAFGGGAIAWTQLNPANDPMGMNDCGVTRCTADEPDELLPGMYDYIDLKVAPDGRPWVAMVDVCHDACLVTGTNDEAIAAVGTLASGPDLVHPGRSLPKLGW